jgi:hypothetical protein
VLAGSKDAARRIGYLTKPWTTLPSSEGTMRAHRCEKTPDTMRSVEMRKRRSETLSKTFRRAEDALPYSTLN